MKQIKIQDEIYQAIYHLDNQELKRLTSNDTLFEIENNFELNRGDIYQLVTITQKRVKKIRSFPENDVIMNIGNPQIEVERQWLWTGERLKEMKIKKQEKTSIVEKYESCTSHREIFKEAGLSAVEIAGELRQLIEASKKAKDRKSWSTALNIASKCLGMQRDAVEAEPGAQIILNLGKAEKEKPKEAKNEPARVVSLAAQE